LHVVQDTATISTMTLVMGALTVAASRLRETARE
jgi:hypothetical protein